MMITPAGRSIVVGLFEDREKAREAIEALRVEGFIEDAISILLPSEQVVQETAAEFGTGVGSGAATGTVVGGVLGGLGGWPLRLDALAIPGVGPFIAAGAFSTALDGAALEAGIGAIAGVLVRMGVPEEHAKYYEGAAKAAKTLLTVRAGGRYDSARRILREHGAYDVESRDRASVATGNPTLQGNPDRTISEGQDTWQLGEEELVANKQSVETGQVQVGKEVVSTQKTLEVPVTREEVTIERYPVERRPSERPIDKQGQSIEVSVREEQVELQDKAVVYEEVSVARREVQETQVVSGTVRREEVRIEREGDLSVGGAGWEQAMPSYRQSWEQRYGTTGDRWEDAEPDYRYGYEMRSRPEYRGRQWSEVEPEVRRDWTQRNPSTSWGRAEESVRETWASGASERIHDESAMFHRDWAEPEVERVDRHRSPDPEVRDYVGPPTLAPSHSTPPGRQQKLNESVLSLGDEDPSNVPSEPLPVSPPSVSTQWINVELHDNNNKQAPDLLALNETYTLVLDVQTELRAASLLQGTSLDYPFSPGEDVVELTVQLMGTDFHIYTEPQKLRVMRGGTSQNKARFDLRPKQVGPAVLSIVILKDGNLIQLLNLKLRVSSEQEPTPQPVGTLAVEVLGRPLHDASIYQPRDVTLVIREQDHGFEVLLRRTNFATATIPISRIELNKLIEEVRKALLDIVQFQAGRNLAKVYQTQIDIPVEIDHAMLKNLARAGQTLYRKLFYGRDADRQLKDMGNVMRELAEHEPLTIQVVSRNFHVPWGVLYVAERFDEHHVEPERFLGLKHVLESIPFQQNLQAVDSLTIPSQPPLAVSLNVDNEIDLQMRASFISDQIAYWREVGRMTGAEVILRETGPAVSAALTDPTTKDQIIYFYCHAVSKSLNDPGGPDTSALKFSDGAPLSLTKLDSMEAVERQLLPGAPLVFINACESAELSPLFYDGFVPYFIGKGARGVIGTECLIPARFAKEWAVRFFDRFLTGASLGQVLLDLRREFYFKHNNLLGLAYAVYCDGDTRVDPALKITRVPSEGRSV